VRRGNWKARHALVPWFSNSFHPKIFPAHLDPAFEIPFLHLISQSGFYVHFVIIAARQLLMVAVIIIKCFAFFLILLPSLLFHFPIPSILFFFCSWEQWQWLNSCWLHFNVFVKGLNCTWLNLIWLHSGVICHSWTIMDKWVNKTASEEIVTIMFRGYVSFQKSHWALVYERCEMASNAGPVQCHL